MKILIIQTAFIGDVILATAMVEKLKNVHPKAEIDFLLRKGNESLLKNHPYVNQCLILDKQGSKYRNIWKIIKTIRQQQYDYVINAQRFFTTGLITALSGGKTKIGFDKNPLSFLFDQTAKHIIGSGENNYTHEVDRNHLLIASITDVNPAKPKLYPSEKDISLVEKYQIQPYICVAPTSVWYTKQFPENKWIEFLDKLDDTLDVYLLGAPSDAEACDAIIHKTTHQKTINLAGELSLLASAVLMKGSRMNYVNDSAPMHLASAVNASVCVVFCSTVPQFGFGPLSDISNLVEVKEELDCRPCGLHGHKACPKGHYKCAQQIDIQQLLTNL